MTLASLLQQGHSLRSIAKVLGRSLSSLSREVARNGGMAGYASQPARQAAVVRRSRARPLPKLHGDGVLWGVVSHLLGWLWSPRQIVRALRRTEPGAGAHCHRRQDAARLAHGRRGGAPGDGLALRQGRDARADQDAGQEQRDHRHP